MGFPEDHDRFYLTFNPRPSTADAGARMLRSLGHKGLPAMLHMLNALPLPKEKMRWAGQLRIENNRLIG